MKAVLVFLAAAAIGAFGAVLLLLRNAAGADANPPVAESAPALSASPVARKNVLLDIEGAVIEEMPGDCADSRYPYLCRYVTKQLLTEDPHLLDLGGLTIRTTIDQRIQRAAQRSIDAYVHRDDPQVATQVMIAPGEGAIRAMAASECGGQGIGHRRRALLEGRPFDGVAARPSASATRAARTSTR
ncbi:MAG: hypothetical protein IRZ07_15520 [Microbispora sp.]|nr:hypothetical protein [Microbispora sp.]